MKSIAVSCLIMMLFLSCQSTPKTAIKEDTPAIFVVDNLVLPDGVSIRDTKRGKVLVADNKVIFAFAKAALPKNAPSTFENIVKYILDKNPNVKIILEAHTSNKGIAYPYNYQLSIKRASAGKKYFNAIGVPNEKIIVKSFAESLPEYPTQKDLRRYEFVIIENDEDLEKYDNFFKTINTRAEMTYDAYNKKQ